MKTLCHILAIATEAGMARAAHPEARQRRAAGLAAATEERDCRQVSHPGKADPGHLTTGRHGVVREGEGNWVWVTLTVRIEVLMDSFA